MERADIAIIGTGPAGISAAITATIRNKKVLLLGSRDLSEKMAKAHEIQNYPGFPAVSGAELVSAFRRHLDEMGIEITEKRVAAVYAMGGYFALQAGEDMIEAKTVILAGGVVAGKPLPGEEEMLGRGVSYCATCDAPLYRQKTVAVIGGSVEEEAEADFLGEVCEKVYYLPLYKEEPHFTHDNIVIVREKPVEIKGAMKVSELVTDQNAYTVDGVFILRAAQFPAQLVPGLAAEGNAVKVDLQMRTNLPGLFAAGDIAGQPYQYIKAAGQGNVAALSAVSYIDEKKRAK